MRASTQQSVDEQRTRVQQVLAIVQHEQHIALAYNPGQGRGHLLLGGLEYTQNSRDSRRHERWIGDGAKFHEPNAVGIVLDLSSGDLDRKPCLTAAADA